jgi:hypothetical protein
MPIPAHQRDLAYVAATEGDTSTARALYLRSLLAARGMGDTLA